MPEKLISIIINNHNYGHFLRDAVSSALDQTYAHTEVIVVDDGSRDASRGVMAGFGERIRPVYKACGGQASALNAGFEISRGEIVIFLDADDRLLPTAAERVIASMQGDATVKAHWPLWVIDEKGARTGGMQPNTQLPEGDLKSLVIADGPGNLPASPTSGNAWSRRFLQEIGPIPEDVYRISADRFLIELAPFLGSLAVIKEPQGEYRVHGKNAYVSQTFEYQLSRALAYYDHCASWLAGHCAAEGYAIRLEDWKKNSWWHRQAAAVEEIARLPARPGSIIFTCDGSWGYGPIAGWDRLPFLEAGGQFAGFPGNDGQAIAELERLRDSGGQYILFPWHAKWWLEVYSDFQKYLSEQYPQIVESEHLVGFDLHPAG